MSNVLSIIDSHQYVAGVPYNRQFQISLGRHFNTTYITLDDIKRNKIKGELHKFDMVISSLRLRTLVQNLGLIKDYLNNHPVIIYEQDPWEAFITDGPYEGSYYDINEKLNVITFVNTTEFWTNFIRDRGLPGMSVTMGILPELCKNYIPWNQRKYDVVFMGGMKSHRKKFFENLKSMKVDVEFLPRKNHEGFLESMRLSKIFLHNMHNPPFIIEGKQWDMWFGYPWTKDIEIAAMGCYAVTNKRDGMQHYGIDNISLIQTFECMDEIPDIIEEIHNKTLDQVHNEIKESISYIKATDHWSSVKKIAEIITKG
tara:strand:- start:11048 stop:11986 length:939 start_codon:yes stop_codon:yes gene_type:complete